MTVQAVISEETSAPGVRGGRRSAWWLVAIVAGGLLGPLDLAGQVAAPYPFAHLFNSPALWAAAAIVFGWWARERLASVVGAVIVMIVGVEAYELADVVLRGANWSNLTSSTAVVWLVAGVAAGVVFGTAGWWGSGRSGWREVVGRAALPAVFGAEAVHNALRVVRDPSDARPDDLGQFATLLLVLAVIALALVVRRASPATLFRAVALAAVAAVVVGTLVNQLI